MRILLTGATGQVGGELLKTLKPLGEIVAPTRVEMDLANTASVRDMVRAVRPRWIVNPGAYTAVDKAESEPELAYAINAEAVRVMGQEARAIGAGVVHFSTDYVFDGSRSVPYREADATGPVSVYGASKLAGETALAESARGIWSFEPAGCTGRREELSADDIKAGPGAREIARCGRPAWRADVGPRSGKDDGGRDWAV